MLLNILTVDIEIFCSQFGAIIYCLHILIGDIYRMNMTFQELCISSFKGICWHFRKQYSSYRLKVWIHQSREIIAPSVNYQSGHFYFWHPKPYNKQMYNPSYLHWGFFYLKMIVLPRQNYCLNQVLNLNHRFKNIFGFRW